MANDNYDISTNEGQISAAIETIDKKKGELENAAREVAKAFTDLTTTVIKALTALMADLNETALTAKSISTKTVV